MTMAKPDNAIRKIKEKAQCTSGKMLLGPDSPANYLAQPILRPMHPAHIEAHKRPEHDMYTTDSKHESKVSSLGRRFT